MKSLRGYLLSRLLGGSALVLALAGLTVYLVSVRSIREQFDRNLEDRVKGFASILFQVGDEVEFEFSGQLMPEYERAEDPAYFQLWFRDGAVLERSESLGDVDLEVPVEPSFVARHWTAPLPDGRPGRHVARLLEVHHVYPEEGPDRPAAAQVLVVVALDRAPIVSAERDLMLRCLGVSLLLMALIGVLAWRAVGKGLEPTRRLAAALDAIEVERLPARLDVGELPEELRPVAQTTDALIGRVDVALARERRTTADIAHELRTPISEVLTASEVALRSNGRDPQGAQLALGTVRDVAARMGRSVSTLLELARLEMGAQAFEMRPVDLAALVDELLPGLASTCRERSIRVASALEPGDRAGGDPEVLRIVLSNLLANAVHHAPVEGTVRCSLERHGERRRLVVENEARDLRPEDLAALTQPFWRKDGARTDRNRSGLGLALSSALAEKSGMELRFELEGGRFRALLELPAAAPSAGC